MLLGFGGLTNIQMGIKGIQGCMEMRVFYENLLNVLGIAAKSKEIMDFGAGITRVRKIGGQELHNLPVMV